MNAVEHPVERNYWLVIRQPIVFSMKDKSMDNILRESPEKYPNKQKRKPVYKLISLLNSSVSKPSSHRKVNNGNSEPRSIRERLEELLVENCAHSNWIYQVLWLVYEKFVVFKCIISPGPELVENAPVVVNLELTFELLSFQACSLWVLARLWKQGRHRSDYRELLEQLLGVPGVTLVLKVRVDLLAVKI